MRSPIKILASVIAASVIAASCRTPPPSDCPPPAPPPCARCADVAALVKEPSELCQNAPTVPGADSATLWDAFEACLCSGACSPACGASCSPPHTIKPSDVNGACELCAQSVTHTPADPPGCGELLQLCLGDAAP